MARDRDIDRVERPPDVEIGARVKAKRLRFKRAPETEVEVRGEAEIDSALGSECENRPEEADLQVDTASGSERKNIPEEVEPGVDYRDVEVRWLAAAKIRRRQEG
jgi:hypothetical protein